MATYFYMQVVLPANKKPWAPYGHEFTDAGMNAIASSIGSNVTGHTNDFTTNCRTIGLGNSFPVARDLCVRLRDAGFSVTPPYYRGEYGNIPVGGNYIATFQPHLLGYKTSPYSFAVEFEHHIPMVIGYTPAYIPGPSMDVYNYGFLSVENMIRARMAFEHYGLIPAFGWVVIT